MSPNKPALRIINPHLPRTCGDEPAMRPGEKIAILSAPHLRG